MENPKVKVDKVTIDENYFTNQDGYVYGAAKLIEHSKKYKEFDMPLAGIDLRRSCWTMDDMDDFIHHAKRCSDANLDYPIILYTCGTIADLMSKTFIEHWQNLLPTSCDVGTGKNH